MGKEVAVAKRIDSKLRQVRYGYAPGNTIPLGIPLLKDDCRQVRVCQAMSSPCLAYPAIRTADVSAAY